MVFLPLVALGLVVVLVLNFHFVDHFLNVRDFSGLPVYMIMGRVTVAGEAFSGRVLLVWEGGARFEVGVGLDELVGRLIVHGKFPPTIFIYFKFSHILIY